MRIKKCSWLSAAPALALGLGASPCAWSQSAITPEQVRVELLVRDAKAIRGANPPPSCFSDGSTLLAWAQAQASHVFKADARGAGPVVSRWSSVDRVGKVRDWALSEWPQLHAQISESNTACVLDRTTRLLWAVNLEGTTPAGRFVGVPAQHSNSVDALVQRAKAANWCGVRDWRLPSRMQVLSLADYTQEDTPESRTAMDALGFSKYGGVLTATALAGAPVAALNVGHSTTKRWVVRIPSGYTYESEDGARDPAYPALLVSHATCTAFNQEFWR